MLERTAAALVEHIFCTSARRYGYGCDICMYGYALLNFVVSSEYQHVQNLVSRNSFEVHCSNVMSLENSDL